VEHLANPAVELVVCNVSPIERFLKHRGYVTGLDQYKKQK
jgi:hypothetical protein